MTCKSAPSTKFVPRPPRRTQLLTTCANQNLIAVSQITKRLLNATNRALSKLNLIHP